jgi:hypothetical protein
MNPRSMPLSAMRVRWRCRVIKARSVPIPPNRERPGRSLR